METLTNLLPLIGFVFAATASPGGATTLVAASGTWFGWSNALAMLIGVLQ